MTLFKRPCDEKEPNQMGRFFDELGIWTDGDKASSFGLQSIWMNGWTAPKEIVGISGGNDSVGLIVD